MKLVKFFSCLAATIAVCAITAANANATITLVNSDSNLIGSDVNIPSLSSTFDVLPGNALVVSATARFSSTSTALDAFWNGANDYDYSFIQGSGDRATVGTFVWLNPTPLIGGTAEVTAGVNARLGYGLYALDGVGGVLDMPDADPNDGIATGGTFGASEGLGQNGNGNTTHGLQYKGVAGGYVIHTLSGEGPGAVPSITGDNVDTNVLYHANGDSGIFITAISSGGSIAADGDYTTTHAYYKAGALSAVVLTGVPEPTSLALLMGGIGFIALGRRR